MRWGSVDTTAASSSGAWRELEGAARSVSHRDGATRRPLLRVARRAAAEGRGRLEPRAPAAVDAVGTRRAADARAEDRARRVLPLQLPRRRELHVRDLRRR